jgi:hypothetical protein
MREIDLPHDAVHGGVANGDQPINQPQRGAVD